MEQLILQSGNIDELIGSIQSTISERYFKNADPLNNSEINSLYELEQGKWFFMELKNQLTAIGL